MDAGIKKIAVTKFPLTPLAPRPAHWRLDGLDLTGPSLNAPERPYRNAEESIEYFVREYPGGFYGDKYLEGERNYKVDTHRQAVVLLDRDRLNGLLDEGNYSEVCECAKRSLANVVNWRESDLLWKQVLGDDAREKAFATRLRTLLYGSRSEDAGFEQFVSWLDNLGAAKWPLSTYFPWILFPDREVSGSAQQCQGLGRRLAARRGIQPASDLGRLSADPSLLPARPRRTGRSQAERLHRRSVLHVGSELAEELNAGPAMPAAPPRASIGDPR